MKIINIVLWRILAKSAGLMVVRFVWFFWEAIENWFVPPYEKIPLTHGIIRVRRITYKGKSLTLRDSTEICPGASILEIHINNRIALKYQLTGISPYRVIRHDLMSLGDWFYEERKKNKEIVAFMATSILAETLEYFKAEIHPWPAGFNSSVHEFFREGLLLIYHRNGIRRLQKSHAPIADGWISARAFIACYAKKRV